MRICQLDGKEALMLEQFNVRPDCSKHPHLRSTEAALLVGNKKFRYVGRKMRSVTRCNDGTGAIYDRVDTSKREYKKAKCGTRGALGTWQLTHDPRIIRTREA
jgi:hypothetical protein